MKIPEIAPEGYYWVKFEGEWQIAHVREFEPVAPWDIYVFEAGEHVLQEQIDELGPRIVAPDVLHDLTFSGKVMRQCKILNPDSYDPDEVRECREAEDLLDREERERD